MALKMRAGYSGCRHFAIVAIGVGRFGHPCVRCGAFGVSVRWAFVLRVDSLPSLGCASTCACVCGRR